MHAFGQTLWRVGDLQVVAVPGAEGRDTYCVAVDSRPVATFPNVERALDFFDALRGTGATRAQETAADAWARRAERQRVLLEGDGDGVDPLPAAPAAAAPAAPAALGTVTDLAVYRRRRASRRPPGSPPPGR